MEGIIGVHYRQFTVPGERVGATYVPGQGVYVRLWAPYLEDVEIEWQGGQRQRLTPGDKGYFTGHFPKARPGDRYYFYYDNGGNRIADPASRAQPEGVSGPSAVVAADYPWTDGNWRGVPFDEWVIYEIHTGAFSTQHDFRGIIDDLPRLKDLGITAIEIMPVSPFPGTRNWGYDGVFPHAVQQSYGGPDGLKELVDACHGMGLAVILDVVYNHVGPEGNVLFQCGPYVRDRHLTPWGAAINFDGPGSDEVRRYFLQSAWQWLIEYHLDGLRLDAVHTVFDDTPLPFLEELAELKGLAEEETGRPLILIAESDMNNPRLVTPAEQNGYGMDAQWADDLHHVIHATLTGEQSGYYADYGGGPAQLARVYRDKVAYNGRFSEYRGRHHGRSYHEIAREKLVTEIQNHDQTGNRAFGERLYSLVGFEKAKLAAACIMLSPFTPLIFMGEELAVKNPFLYFVDHQIPALREAVRKGRLEEWHAFSWGGDPPDPSAPETFERSVLKEKRPNSSGKIMTDYYRCLIGYSKELRGLEPEVDYLENCALIALKYEEAGLQALLSFSEEENFFDPEGAWQCVMQSSRFQTGKEYAGFCIPGRRLNLAPYSAAVLRRVHGG